MMLAAFTKSAELLVDESEAQQLAQATANVSRHYNAQIAAKTIDWVNFATVAGMVYGTRLVAIRNRHAAERRANPPAPKAANKSNVETYYEGLSTLDPDMTQTFQAG
jgi:hypothetical protein